MPHSPGSGVVVCGPKPSIGLKFGAMCLECRGLGPTEGRRVLSLTWPAVFSLAPITAAPSDEKRL